MRDVIIIGGGVAGCYIASLLPPNLDILVLEKHKKVRPKDSGIVSKKFSMFFDDSKLIKDKVNEIECISPSNKKFILNKEEPFLYLIKRESFTRVLRKNAEKKAEIRYENVEEIIHKKNFVIVKTNKSQYEAKMVVGCDGAGSMTRKSLKIQDPTLSVGVMVKTDKRMADRVQVFFNKYYSPDFFSWIIPQHCEYGLITAFRPKEYLDFFTKQEFLPKGDLYAYMIPTGTTKSFANRAVLVGDACGQNKPLTGGGIIFSLVCSRIAAQIIKDSFEQKNFSSTFLSNYELMWKHHIKREIDKQLWVRKAYRNMTNEEIDEVFDSFGSHIENMPDFDYDNFTSAWKQMPKMKLLKFAVSKAAGVF